MKLISARFCVAVPVAVVLLAPSMPPPTRAQAPPTTAAAGAGEPLGLVEVASLFDAGDLERALERLEVAARSGEETNPGVLEIYRWRHRLLHELGRLEAAQEAGRAWVGAAAEHGTAEDRTESRLGLYRSYASQGRDLQAAETLRPALVEIDDLADEELAARLLIRLASVEIALGRYAQAAELLTRADRRTEDLQASAPFRLRLLLAETRGSLEHFRGDPYAALEHRRRAAEIAQEGGDLQDATRIWANIGHSQIRLHDYATAIANLERSLALGDFAEPTARAGLGIAYFELNQLERAEREFEAVRRLAQRAGNPRLEAFGVGEIGLVLTRRGELDQALEAFDRAIELTAETGDRRNQMVWWMAKGQAERDRQRFADALPHYQRAFDLGRQIEGLRIDANLYKHIGQCHAGLGRDDLARPLFLRALEEARAVADTKVVWETHRELGRLEQRAGDLAAARSAFLAALDAVEDLRGGLRLEAFKTDFFENKNELYSEVIELLVRTDRLEEALLVAERSRARGFLDTLAESRARLEQTLPESILDRERSLLDQISELQATLREGSGGEGIERALADAERELASFELKVRTDFPRFAALQSPEPVSIEELRSTLGDGESLLAFSLGESLGHGWLLDADRLEHWTLPARSDVDRAVRSALTELLLPDRAPELDLLADLLIGPAKASLDDVTSLVVLPDGILYHFPFEALPVPAANGTTRTMSEAIPIAYAPSASALVELRLRPSPSTAPRLLAVADVDYAAAPAERRSASTLRGLRDLGSLPHTLREAKSLRRLFGGRRTTLLMGGAATEVGLAALPLESYSVLHFATHGIVDAAEPERSGLVLGVSGGDDDGLLQPREILRLTLDADLVTLSACQSALGQVVTGEGMVSLARSFFYAGADAVVASLWSVDDRASAELMEAFYRNLAEGQSKARALQKARQELASDRRYAHPYYWAPFVLIGDGSSGVEIPDRLRFLAPGVAVLAAVVGALLWLVWRRGRHQTAAR